MVDSAPNYGQGLVNVQIKHHLTVRDIISKTYLKVMSVMSKIPNYWTFTTKSWISFQDHVFLQGSRPFLSIVNHFSNHFSEEKGMIAHVGEKCLGQSCLEGGRRRWSFLFFKGENSMTFNGFIWTIEAGISSFFCATIFGAAAGRGILDGTCMVQFP